MKNALMLVFISVGALLMGTVGCAPMRRNFTPVLPSDKWIACHTYGYCGEYAGALMVGDDVCFTNDVKRGLDNGDIQCR